jgi:hypothetical protein
LGDFIHSRGKDVADNTQQVQRLLLQVSKSMEALEELQQLYKEQKAAILGQVESSVSKLAQLADTQAVRAMALRELYWNQDVSADLLAQVFGLTSHRMRKLAGALVIEKACEGNCGNTINKTYTSKSALAEKRKWGKDLCDSCIEQKKRADAERSAKLEEQQRERYNYLVSLEWDEFIETNEWAYLRNTVLHHNDYACEICHNDSCTIYIYPHKETPQYRPGGFKYTDVFFALCQSCIPRCEDLIVKGRRDIIRPELKELIADRRAGGY